MAIFLHLEKKTLKAVKKKERKKKKREDGHFQTRCNSHGHFFSLSFVLPPVSSASASFLLVLLLSRSLPISSPFVQSHVTVMSPLCHGPFCSFLFINEPRDSLLLCHYSFFWHLIGGLFPSSPSLLLLFFSSFPCHGSLASFSLPSPSSFSNKWRGFARAEKGRRLPSLVETSRFADPLIITLFRTHLPDLVFILTI